MSSSAPNGKGKSKLVSSKDSQQQFKVTAAATGKIGNGCSHATNQRQTQRQIQIQRQTQRKMHSVPSTSEEANSFILPVNASPESNLLSVSDDLLNISFQSSFFENISVSPPPTYTNDEFNNNNTNSRGSSSIVLSQLNPLQIPIPTLNPLIAPIPSPSPIGKMPALPLRFHVNVPGTNSLLNQLPNMNVNPSINSKMSPPSSLISVPTNYFCPTTNPNVAPVSVPVSTPYLHSATTVPVSLPVSVAPSAPLHAPVSNGSLITKPALTQESTQPLSTQPLSIQQKELNISTHSNSNRIGTQMKMSEEELYNHYHFITGKFITQYYNSWQSEDPQLVKNFYHIDAEIHRVRISTDSNKNEKAIKIKTSEILKFLTGDNCKLILVDVKNAIHQKGICNSILIQVDGVIQLQDDHDMVKTRTFEQTFFVNKGQSEFWLIQNDILSYTYINNNTSANKKENANTRTVDSDASINSQKENDKNKTNLNHSNLPKLPKMSPNNNLHPTWSSITASKSHQTQHPYPVHPTPHNFDDTPHGHNNGNTYNNNNNNNNNNGHYVRNYDVPQPQSQVNKRMVNRFYHDTSYQRYDNNLAIFIKGIPNDLTHGKLCGILRMSLIEYCDQYTKNRDASIFSAERLKEMIKIDYIDVNYHKEFAFVYLGNFQTFDIALKMGHLFIGPRICEIQQKQSHNGPRRFSNSHYNQSQPRNNGNNKHYNHHYQRRQ